MIDSDNHPRLMPNVRIGVPGLPNLTNNMVQGGLYVLVAETASARFPLFSSSLGCSLKDGRRCTAVVPGNPEHFIQRLESLGDMKAEKLLTSNQFQLFVIQEEFSKKMFRFGAERFVAELEQFEIPDNSYLLFDQADDLISLHDVSLAIEQVDILSKWLEQHQVTALLAFLRSTEAHAGTINALMDYLTGIVRLGGDGDGLRLGFDYWQSPEGTVAARSFQLLTLENNCYEAVAKHSGNDAQVTDPNNLEMIAPPEEAEASYFYMDPDLGSLSTQVPGQWQRVDTLVGMMHATRNKRRAIAIFCYQSDTNLRQLAEAIHTLRINLGKYAQIIVQEKNASLRYQNEALLLRLGVNLVVHRDVQPARMPLMLGSVYGQIFSRDVDINFEAAMSSVTSSALKGYLPPSRFSREVETLQERAATLNIPYALIIARPKSTIAMADVVTGIKLSRPGDLLTADHETCYLFFNACQQSVILPTLERLLGCPVEQVFDDVRFQVDHDEITHEIAALLHNADAGLVQDYSNLVAAATPAPAAAPARTHAGPASMSVSPIVSASPQASAFQAATSDTPAGVFAERTVLPRAVRPVDIQNETASISPPHPATTPANSESTSLYRQTNPSLAVFGKQEVPRATRSPKKARPVETGQMP